MNAFVNQLIDAHNSAVGCAREHTAPRPRFQVSCLRRSASLSFSVPRAHNYLVTASIPGLEVAERFPLKAQAQQAAAAAIWAGAPYALITFERGFTSVQELWAEVRS